MNIKAKKAGAISNYYGHLYIAKRGKHCYWGVEDYDGVTWQQIPTEVYNAINTHMVSNDEPQETFGFSDVIYPKKEVST